MIAECGACAGLAPRPQAPGSAFFITHAISCFKCWSASVWLPQSGHASGRRPAAARTIRVRHVCDGGRRGRRNSREMVRSDTSTPTLPNSPWIRPQSGFATAIWVTSVRMVASVLGRPTRIRAERRVHRRRSHSRCHRTTVSGWTSTSAARQCRPVWANAIQNRRSRLRSCGRQPVRFKALSCWRSASCQANDTVHRDEICRSYSDADNALRLASGDWRGLSAERLRGVSWNLHYRRGKTPLTALVLRPGADRPRKILGMS
jgi:hypothetical protein